MKSQNWGTVVCDECGTRVSIDDAESSYNAELDDVFFYCHKCIYDPMSYLPGAPDDTDEAVEHTLAHGQGLCPKCDSEILPSQYCMMGHWCGERPAGKA